MSKSLSDHMFYLLAVKPNMLPKGISDSGSGYQDELENAIAISIDTTATIPGAYGSSKYLLVHGCKLAQQLQKLEIEK
ncbi:hypothetical protein SADUNF_Sadunf03G0039400 [Salix dunnii]|uniref:Uncharacterized protein n=1 Tax=Salix dunnii TaxID=1413687 RepID=A0A835K6Y1_9ROSI|nr:hypothetical protein SADUNF_Sadunf03G0039400 [Salix dunnii]